MTLISMNEAAAQGIERICQPHWAFPTDYFKLDIIDGRLGPWVHLYSRMNETISQPNPQDVLWIMEGGAAQADERVWLPYEGEIDPDETPPAPDQTESVRDEV